jgi:hypothetical protein
MLVAFDHPHSFVFTEKTVGGSEVLSPYRYFFVAFA